MMFKTVFLSLFLDVTSEFVDYTFIWSEAIKPVLHNTDTSLKLRYVVGMAVSEDTKMYFAKAYMDIASNIQPGGAKAIADIAGNVQPVAQAIQPGGTKAIVDFILSKAAIGGVGAGLAFFSAAYAYSTQLKCDDLNETAAYLADECQILKLRLENAAKLMRVTRNCAGVANILDLLENITVSAGRNLALVRAARKEAARYRRDKLVQYVTTGTAAVLITASRKPYLCLVGYPFCFLAYVFASDDQALKDAEKQLYEGHEDCAQTVHTGSSGILQDHVRHMGREMGCET